MSTRNWLLPEFIEDILPAEAQHIEQLRRTVLDLFRVHGFELVMPPLLEYVESLLTGAGHDLDLKTFKLVDQLSGRLLGLRADITPQAARIDAHLLNRPGITRLCYAGSIMHTLPSGLTRTREPFQIGAELFGHAGLESDVEIQRLMLEALRTAGILNAHLDLGHVAVFRSLAQHAAIPPEIEDELFRALQVKDIPAVRALATPFAPEIRHALVLLPELYGGVEALDRAEKWLPAFADIAAALRDLRAVGDRLADLQVTCCFDLAELRGYQYQNALVFAAYVDGWPNAIAQGGRYDEVGKAFGRARPATGFSMDLRELAAIAPPLRSPLPIRAPCANDAALNEAIASLRAQGEIVFIDLPGRGAERSAGVDHRQLVFRDGRWQVDSAEATSSSQPRKSECPETSS